MPRYASHNVGRVLFAGAVVFMLGAAVPLPDEIETQLQRFSYSLGRTAGLAVACNQRSTKWFDAVESQLQIDAIAMLEAKGTFKNDPSGELSAQVAAVSEGYFEGGARIAAQMFLEDGPRHTCPVTTRTDPELPRADKMAKVAAGPHDWSGVKAGTP